MLEKINTLLNMTKSKKRETSANDNVVNDTLIDEIDNDDNDDNGHGTGVMGIMAGAESGVEGKDKVDHVAIKVF